MTEESALQGEPLYGENLEGEGCIFLCFTLEESNWVEINWLCDWDFLIEDFKGSKGWVVWNCNVPDGKWGW